MDKINLNEILDRKIIVEQITNCLNKPVNLNLNQEINIILIMSYMLESMFCLNEMLYYNNIYIDKAFYVSYSSILLAILIAGYT